MNDIDWLTVASRPSDETLYAQINQRIAPHGIAISRKDAQSLAESRAEVLAETERIEFGEPAIVSIAEAVAASPALGGNHIARELQRLQAAFYILRDELAIDVPDYEIIDALRGWLDAQGDIDSLETSDSDEIMQYSKDYRRALATDDENEYRIADDTGRIYAFNERDWEYDEQACGWDGERWSDDFDD